VIYANWVSRVARDWLHVIPMGDLREHEATAACWCVPVEDDGVVVHNALDGREAYERGERKVS
jgi:hypothetical protein